MQGENRSPHSLLVPAAVDSAGLAACRIRAQVIKVLRLALLRHKLCSPPQTRPNDHQKQCTNINEDR